MAFLGFDQNENKWRDGEPLEAESVEAVVSALGADNPTSQLLAGYLENGFGECVACGQDVGNVEHFEEIDGDRVAHRDCVYVANHLYVGGLNVPADFDGLVLYMLPKAERETLVAEREAEAKAKAEARAKARASAERKAQRTGGRVCGKCDGRGHIPGFEHVQNGTCFQCGGDGVVGN